MLTAEVYESPESRPGVVTIRVVVNSDAGGVQSVTLLDRERNPIPPGTFPVEGCPPTFTFRVPGVSSGSLPVYLEGEECGGSGRQPINGPFLYRGGQPDGSNLPCPPPGITNMPFREPSQACREAMRSAGVLREQLILECANLTSRRTIRDATLAMMIAAWVLAVLTAIAAALAFASIIFAGAGVGLSILAGMLFGFAVGLTVAFAVAEAALTAAAQTVRNLRERFHEARDRVQRSCCPGDFAQQLLDDPC